MRLHGWSLDPLEQLDAGDAGEHDADERGGKSQVDDRPRIDARDPESERLGSKMVSERRSAA
jgi:hypothetical protein